MVDSINALDYFKDATTELDKKYDFNNDGTVDIADYQIARVYLSDESTADKIQFSQADLDIVFSALIEADEDTNKYSNIDEANANNKAEEIIKAVNSGATNPENAETLNELQTIGATLTKYIKECADLSKILAAQIPILKNELDELEEEKEAKQREYDTKASQVEAKTQELDRKLVKILEKSNRMSEEFQNKCNNVVNTCIENYKNGDYAGKDLSEVITTQLALQGGANTSDLKREINNSTTIGLEIKSLCGDIENIVADIRDVTQRYNAKNTTYNRTVNNRNDILKCAQTASLQYQKGYTVRQNMRKVLVDKYYVEGNGTISSSNPQIQKLAEFLDAKELNNMPFSDAWNVLKESFGQCGITYADNGTITFPRVDTGDATTQNIYSALKQSLLDNYGVKVEEEAYVDTTSPTSPTVVTTPIPPKSDPMSFTDNNIKYEFISDNNGNGKFDDKSEFLGAQNGWEEMKAYDKDGNGIIAGEELKALKMVAVDQTTGQYTFTNANFAGVQSINLNSYKEANKEQITGDTLAGTFEVNVNGQVIQAYHTLDTEKNLDNKYATLFGEEIKNQNEMYEENPFMEDMIEAFDTKQKVNNAESDIATNDFYANANLKSGINKGLRKVDSAIEEARIEKRKADAKEESKEENNNVTPSSDSEKPSAQSSTVANEDTSKKKFV